MLLQDSWLKSERSPDLSLGRQMKENLRQQKCHRSKIVSKTVVRMLRQLSEPPTLAVIFTFSLSPSHLIQIKFVEMWLSLVQPVIVSFMHFDATYRHCGFGTSSKLSDLWFTKLRRTQQSCASTRWGQISGDFWSFSGLCPIWPSEETWLSPLCYDISSHSSGMTIFGKNRRWTLEPDTVFHWNIVCFPLSPYSVT